jgi:hypothetical protein
MFLYNGGDRVSHPYKLYHTKANQARRHEGVRAGGGGVPVSLRVHKRLALEMDEGAGIQTAWAHIPGASNRLELYLRLRVPTSWSGGCSDDYRSGCIHPLPHLQYRVHSAIHLLKMLDDSLMASVV